MASWSPTVDDTTDLIAAWQAAADDPLVSDLIQRAVHEIVGEVGDFDPAVVINTSSDEADQVTLGDLAHDAAAIRAAHQWASAIAPEMNDPDFVRQLYARYVDQLERLKRWSGTVGSAYTVDMAGYGLSAHLPWCSLHFGGGYCSCGVDIAGYPIYELG